MYLSLAKTLQRAATVGRRLLDKPLYPDPYQKSLGRDPSSIQKFVEIHSVFFV